MSSIYVEDRDHRYLFSPSNHKYSNAYYDGSYYDCKVTSFCSLAISLICLLLITVLVMIVVMIVVVIVDDDDGGSVIRYDC
jgi:hypothetical protein